VKPLTKKVPASPSPDEPRIRTTRFIHVEFITVIDIAAAQAT
jgi:hypothetical protein